MVKVETSTRKKAKTKPNATAMTKAKARTKSQSKVKQKAKQRPKPRSRSKSITARKKQTTRRKSKRKTQCTCDFWMKLIFVLTFLPTFLFGVHQVATGLYSEHCNSWKSMGSFPCQFLSSIQDATIDHYEQVWQGLQLALTAALFQIVRLTMNLIA